jgi:uncharacterized membrane protein
VKSRAATIFVGFVHDFAAGIWVGATFAIWWLSRASVTSALASQLFGLKQGLFFIALGCVAVVMLAGAGRTFTYAATAGVYGEDAEELRKRMLLIKHAVLLAVFAVGTVWQYFAVYR